MNFAAERIRTWTKILVSVCLLGAVSGCAESPTERGMGGQIAPHETTIANLNNSQTQDKQVPRETAVPPITVQEESKLTLLAVGDIMVHQEQIESAYVSKRKSYDFSPSFARISPLLQGGDIVIGNLETTLSGKEMRYSGYPKFNTPESLLAALQQAGFTALTTANNHSLDRREQGVMRTLDHLEKAGIPSTGTFRTAQEREEPLILEKNGIKLGVIAYTYGTNGIPIPEGKPFLVNLIRPKLIQQDIATARARGADIVAVALHFGDEYQRWPNSYQRSIVDQCLQFGADLILGTHPHVVQPYEWRTVKQADGRLRRGLVFYSLGNFISAQRGDYKDVGAIAKVVISKQGSGTAVIEKAELIPTYVHYFRTAGKRNYLVYPVEETLRNKQQQKDPYLTEAVYHKLQGILGEMSVHATSMTAR